MKSFILPSAKMPDLEPKTLFYNGTWNSGNGSSFQSVNPANQEVIWEGLSANSSDIDQAILSASTAFSSWSKLPFQKRLDYIEKFSLLLSENKKALAKLISQETGKPYWESLTEVGAMIGKTPISIEAYEERCPEKQNRLGNSMSCLRFKPHGVIAVFGPFNLPGHLPNGHLIPALLAGNTIVFKPSELTPSVGQRMVELWNECNLPAGVLNLVQGGKSTGESLARHPLIKGLYFTGSFTTGKFLHRLFGGQPEKILVLEMGGNNPLIVDQVSNPQAAAYTAIQSAYITSGQRCVCARRLIIPEGKENDTFLQSLTQMIETIQTGPYTDTPEPFMGPVISIEAANQLIKTQDVLLYQGANALMEMKQDSSQPAFLSPGLIDVTSLKNREDKELFGPLLQLIRTPDFEMAIEEANRTAYGLSAGLLSDDPEAYEIFLSHSNAGIINWNRQITGASSSSPFGGTGKSGNHRPSAYFAADYCSYPIASIEAEQLQLPEKLTPGISLDTKG